MSITGPGSITAQNIMAVNAMNDQLNKLSTELSTNQAAQTYSDLGSQAGIVLSLNSQLAAITGYGNTATTVGTTLSVAQSTLSQLDTTRTQIQQSIGQQGTTFTLNTNGQTSIQASAQTQLGNILSLLNTQVGDNYIFSGNASNQQPVASSSAILNGNGAQAGLIQVTANRLAADEGANGLGRLTIPAPTATTVSISEDSNSPFGFKLGSVGSSLTGATVTGPSGSPPSVSINLASNPNAGDSIQFALTLPDGTSQSVTLTATTASPPGANQFTIGTTAAQTATNLQTALSSSVTSLAQTALPAASAIAAANNFFADPPQIVSGTPATSATSLVNGTPANTVFWYTGDNGATPARQTATAQVGPTTSISYGMRATEPAFTTLVANVAALAAASYSPSNPNAQASYQALSQRVAGNLDNPSGTQSVADVEADLANAQTTVSNAGKLNTQTQSTLQDMLQNIDGVNTTQIGEQLMTLQNSLSATLSVTARMAQLSLVNFLAPSAG
jgi:flagellin-like hook-associated protein FlgL